MGSSGNVRVFLIALFSALGALLFGMDMGYIGAFLLDPYFKRDVAHLPNWNDSGAHIPGAISGFIVGVFALGCVCTSFPIISDYLLDNLGRNASIIIGAWVFTVGAALQAMAGSVSIFVLGRFIAGCSVGVLSTAVPLYQAELSPPELRGSLASLFQVLIIVGIVIASILDNIFLGREGGWRISVWFQVPPAICLAFGMLFMPSSPRWLVKQGRCSDALKALQTYRPSADAERELQEMQKHHETAQALGEACWADIFTGRGGKLLAVGMLIQLLQQLQGINAIIYFGPEIFAATNVLNPNTCQTVMSAVLVLGTLPAPVLADLCGRRMLFALSAFFQGLPSIVIGALGLSTMVRQGEGWSSTSVSAGWTVAVSVLVFVFNFGYGWGPFVWVYCAEMFPLKYRSRCLGLTTMANWIGVYIVGQLTPILLNSIGFATFLLFSLSSLAAILLAKWLPETKGVMLEHVDHLFDDKFGSPAGKRHGSCDPKSQEISTESEAV